MEKRVFIGNGKEAKIAVKIATYIVLNLFLRLHALLHDHVLRVREIHVLTLNAPFLRVITMNHPLNH